MVNHVNLTRRREALSEGLYNKTSRPGEAEKSTCAVENRYLWLVSYQANELYPHYLREFTVL